jgi:glycosyltransferase involved in cell wall biosynthesis
MGISIQSDSAAKSGGKRLQGVLAESRPNQPLVSVVTAIFNGQPYVAGCLDSVLGQDYPNIEHIVMDGESNDGTVEVLRSYDDRIALWRSERDRGIYDAWNKALLDARGEWICFLGVDDEFLPGAISAYMECAANNPQAEYLTSEGKLVFSSGKVRIVGRPWKWKEFSRRVHTCHVGSMHRRTLFERLGNFDTSYKIAGDYEFLLRSRSELRTAFFPKETVLVRAGGVCYSPRVFNESFRAKHETGGLPKALALYDFSSENIEYRASSLAHRILDSIKSGKPH